VLEDFDPFSELPDFPLVIHGSSLQSSLAQDAVKGRGMKILARVARHRNRTRLRSVPELTVTPSRSNLAPPVLLQKANDIPDLHSQLSIAVTGMGVQRRRPL
jgi:hypothetical protein